MLVDEHKVAWSDPVSKWLPELEFPGAFETRDGAYVALAELIDATLVTNDRRLASAPGVLCRVEVLA